MEGAFKVGEWFVDPSLNELSSPEVEPIRLEGKVMEVLVCLAEQPRKVISKEKIIQAVWSDTFVSDDALFRCIRELRKFFNDNPRDPRYIETIPRRGYRLIAEVQNHQMNLLKFPTSELPQNESNSSQSTSIRMIWFLPAVVILAVVIAAIWNYQSSTTLAATDAVAVLPFVNVNQDPDLDYLSMGITDSIAFGLSQVEGVKVISNMASIQYKGVTDPKKVARDLGVRTLLLGRFSTGKEGLMISAELVDGIENRLLWGHTLRGRPEEILDLQEEITRAVTQRLQFQFQSPSISSLDRYATENIEVYHLYLKGRYQWGLTTADGCRKAIEYFNAITEIEPDYALAYSGLADAYTTMGFFNFMDSRTALSNAKEAAQKALQLDDSLAEAHTSLAGVLLVNDWNWTDSRKHFETALRLDPNYDTTHHWLGVFNLAPNGHFDQAIGSLRRAQQSKPASLRVNTGLGYVLYVAGRLDDAIKQFQFTLGIDAEYEYPWYYLALTYIEKGDLHLARKYMTTAIEKSAGAPYTLAGMAYLNALSGNRKEAEEQLKSLAADRGTKQPSAYEMAVLCSALDRVDDAFDWFAAAQGEKDYSLLYLKVDPRLRDLQDDPRMKDLRNAIFNENS